MSFSLRRTRCSMAVALVMLGTLPVSSLLAQTPTPTPTPRPTPSPSPTPTPTSRPTPTPTPGAPTRARQFEVSSTEIRREPFSLVGRVESELGDEERVATGAVAGRRLVTSAAEVMWSEDTGFAEKVIFQRGQLGSEVLQRTRATYIVILSSFSRAESTQDRANSNVGALLFKDAPAQGRALDLQPTKDNLTVDHRNFMLGYFAGIGDGRRMGGLSEIKFRKVDGTMLFRPQNVDSFASLSLGAPVFHGLSVGTEFHPILVGTVVSRSVVRGFSARLIRDLQQ